MSALAKRLMMAAGASGEESFPASNAVLLLHFDNNFYDATGRHTVTNNGVTFTTSSKFGTHAASYDGTTDYLKVPASADFSFGTGPFAISFWFNKPDDNRRYFMDYRNPGSTGNKSVIAIQSGSSGSIDIYEPGTGGYLFYSSSFNITNNVWHHFEVNRSGAEIYVFLDGTRITNNTGVMNADRIFGVSDTPLAIGGYTDSAGNIVGVIDEFLIVKGAVLHTANFTPPTAPYTV